MVLFLKFWTATLLPGLGPLFFGTFIGPACVWACCRAILCTQVAGSLPLVRPGPVTGRPGPAMASSNQPALFAQPSCKQSAWTGHKVKQQEHFVTKVVQHKTSILHASKSATTCDAELGCCIKTDSICGPPYTYLTPRLGSSFFGDFDRFQAFAWLDALWSQSRGLLTPGSWHFGFPTAWLTSSLTWRSAHHRSGIHGWALHTSVSQGPKALRQRHWMNEDDANKRQGLEKNKYKTTVNMLSHLQKLPKILHVTNQLSSITVFIHTLYKLKRICLQVCYRCLRQFPILGSLKCIHPSMEDFPATG